MIVGDLMTRNAASVRSGQTLAAAAQTMWDCDCGAVPVIESEGDKVIGMVTDRDICMATWSRGLPPGAISVDEVMSQDLVRCTPQDTILRAEALMRSKQVRRIPVVDSGQHLVGILSLADIARATTDTPVRRSDGDLSTDGLATTLAGICRTSLSPSTITGPSASA
jgi:CBS domain-containing protein